MTKKQAWEDFKRIHAKGTYDYWRTQLDWSYYTDILCRCGEITLKQYETWLTPFKYGRAVTFK